MIYNIHIAKRCRYPVYKTFERKNRRNEFTSVPETITDDELEYLCTLFVSTQISTYICCIKTNMS